MSFFISIGQIQDQIDQVIAETGSYAEFPNVIRQLYQEKKYTQEMPRSLGSVK